MTEESITEHTYNNKKFISYMQYYKLTSDSLAYRENQLHLATTEHCTVSER
jgi:hypothetical protein